MNLDDNIERTTYGINFFNSPVENQARMLEEVKQSHPGHSIIAELEKMHEFSKTL